MVMTRSERTVARLMLALLFAAGLLVLIFAAANARPEPRSSDAALRALAGESNLRPAPPLAPGA
jgi:hypothetical protein